MLQELLDCAEDVKAAWAIYQGSQAKPDYAKFRVVALRFLELEDVVRDYAVTGGLAGTVLPSALAARLYTLRCVSRATVRDIS